MVSAGLCGWSRSVSSQGLRRLLLVLVCLGRGVVVVASRFLSAAPFPPLLSTVLLSGPPVVPVGWSGPSSLWFVFVFFGLVPLVAGDLDRALCDSVVSVSTGGDVIGRLCVSGVVPGRLLCLSCCAWFGSLVVSVSGGGSFVSWAVCVVLMRGGVGALVRRLCRSEFGCAGAAPVGISPPLLFRRVRYWSPFSRLDCGSVNPVPLEGRIGLSCLVGWFGEPDRGVPAAFVISGERVRRTPVGFCRVDPCAGW